MDSRSWDSFVFDDSSNGEFMHSRIFLDYHKQKFKDYSLFVVHKSEIVALFPAAATQMHPLDVVSHPGASYGGIVLNKKFGGEGLIQVTKTIIDYYSKIGVHSLKIKIKPWEYSKNIIGEEIYAWWRFGGALSKIDLSNIVDVPNFQTSKRRKRTIKKLEDLIRIEQGFDFVEIAYEIISQTLQERHSVVPVHSISEIQELLHRIPNHIRISCGFLGDTPVSALILFVNTNAAIVQYWGSTEDGRKINALDPLVLDAINWCSQQSLRWFVPGVSTSQDGLWVDTGIYDYKASWNANAISVFNMALQF